MKARRLFGLGASFALVLGSLHAAGPAASPHPATADSAKAHIETGPATNWTYPVFTDKEGYRKYLLRGSTARVLDPNRIQVTGFNCVVFSGDAAERVDTVLLSPEALFFPKDNRASGSSSVRLLFSGRPDTPNDDIEVIGRDWVYDHGRKAVSLAHNVRVTFHAQLHDILK
jgi:hypothetical protein